MGHLGLGSRVEHPTPFSCPVWRPKKRDVCWVITALTLTELKAEMCDGSGVVTAGAIQSILSPYLVVCFGETACIDLAFAHACTRRWFLSKMFK